MLKYRCANPYHESNPHSYSAMILLDYVKMGWKTGARRWASKIIGAGC